MPRGAALQGSLTPPGTATPRLGGRPSETPSCQQLLRGTAASLTARPPGRHVLTRIQTAAAQTAPPLDRKAEGRAWAGSPAPHRICQASWHRAFSPNMQTGRMDGQTGGGWVVCGQNSEARGRRALRLRAESRRARRPGSLPPLLDRTGRCWVSAGAGPGGVRETADGWGLRKAPCGHHMADRANNS